MMNVTNATTTTTKTRILKKRSSIFRTKNQQATINNVDTLSSSSSCQHRQQRRTVVRFHHQVAIHQVASSLSSSSTSSTWLSLAEYNAIRSRVFETLDQHYYPHNNNNLSTSSSSLSSSAASSVYCFRGLEEYCPKNKGAFHEHVRARRKHVVSAVLQRQRTLPHGSTTNNNDHILRQVSERYTQPNNLHQGLTRGADDSHAAFTVYAEQHQRQPPPPPQLPSAAAAAPPHPCPPPAAAQQYRHKEISREYEPMLPPIVTHPTVPPKNSICRLDVLMQNE